MALGEGRIELEAGGAVVLDAAGASCLGTARGCLVLSAGGFAAPKGGLRGTCAVPCTALRKTKDPHEPAHYF